MALIKMRLLAPVDKWTHSNSVKLTFIWDKAEELHPEFESPPGWRVKTLASGKKTLSLIVIGGSEESTFDKAYAKGHFMMGLAATDDYTFEVV